MKGWPRSKLTTLENAEHVYMRNQHLARKTFNE